MLNSFYYTHMYWPTFKIIKIKAKWASTSNSDRVTGLGLTFLLYTAKQLAKVCEKIFLGSGQQASQNCCELSLLHLA